MKILKELVKNKEASERQIDDMKRKIEMCFEQIEQYKELIDKEEERLNEWEQAITVFGYLNETDRNIAEIITEIFEICKKESSTTK